MTLAFGPMKPVGLVDPRTGARPFAVVQLRPEDAAATAYNLVGFQTRMTWPEQARVLRTIPGLEARRVPALRQRPPQHVRRRAARCSTRACSCARGPGVFLAGQITGVEGYVESCAGGFVCGVMLAQALLGEPIAPPPPTTALGGVLTHLAGPRRLPAVEHDLGLAAAARGPTPEEAGALRGDGRAGARRPGGVGSGPGRPAERRADHGADEHHRSMADDHVSRAVVRAGRASSSPPRAPQRRRRAPRSATSLRQRTRAGTTTPPARGAPPRGPRSPPCSAARGPRTPPRRRGPAVSSVPTTKVAIEK